MGENEHQNVLRCQNGRCHHYEDLGDRSYPKGLRSFDCTKCVKGRMTVRCGAVKEDGSRCFRVAKIGGLCGGKGGHDPSSPRPKTTRSAGTRNGQASTLRNTKMLPKKAGKPPPGKVVQLEPARVVAPCWQNRYVQAREDREAQGQMVHQLAILAAMEDECNARVGTGESAATWKRLGSLAKQARKLMDSIADAAAARDLKKANEQSQALMAHLARELLPTIEDGVGEEAARAELRHVIVTRGKQLTVSTKIQALLTPAAMHTVLARLLFIIDEKFEPVVGRKVLDEVLLQCQDEFSFKAGPRLEVPVDGNGRQSTG